MLAFSFCSFCPPFPENLPRFTDSKSLLITTVYQIFTHFSHHSGSFVVPPGLKIPPCSDGSFFPRNFNNVFFAPMSGPPFSFHSPPPFGSHLPFFFVLLILASGLFLRVALLTLSNVNSFCRLPLRHLTLPQFTTTNLVCPPRRFFSF